MGRLLTTLRSRAGSDFVRGGLEALYAMDLETSNLVRNSEDIAAWALAVGVNRTFDGFTESTETGQHAVLPGDVPHSGGAYAWGVEVKPNGRTRVRISVYDGAYSAFGIVNLSTGEVTSTGASGAFSVPTVTAEAAGDGFTRVAMVGTYSGTVIKPQLSLVNDAGGVSYTGDGASGVYARRGQANMGAALLPYVPTSNKRAVYDYSGNDNHAYLGSAGTAFINPVGSPRCVNLPGTTGNTLTTPNTTGGTAYYTITYADGTTEDGSTAANPIEIGGTVHSGAVARVRVFSDSGRTALVADCDPNDAPGDVTKFYSSTTGELWTINQSAATTNDPVWTGQGLVFDGVDDVVTGPVMPFAGGDALSLFLAFNPGGSADHTGLVDGYHSLVSVADGTDSLVGRMMFRTFTSQPGLSYFIRMDATTEDVVARSSPHLITPVLPDYASWSVVWDKALGGSKHYRNGEFVQEFDYSDPDTGLFARTGAAIRLGMRAAGSDPSDFPQNVVAVYYRTLTADEVAQNHRAAQRLLAKRGITL